LRQHARLWKGSDLQPEKAQMRPDEERAQLMNGWPAMALPFTSHHARPHLWSAPEKVRRRAAGTPNSANASSVSLKVTSRVAASCRITNAWALQFLVRRFVPRHGPASPGDYPPPLAA